MFVPRKLGTGFRLASQNRNAWSMAFAIGIIVIRFLFAETALATEGNIAIWHNDQPIALKVTLPEFSKGILGNELLHFEKLPENFKPDANGCFCFGANDERLAFVHLYYHVSHQIAYFNTLLESLGAKPVKNVAVSITRDTSLPFSISVNENTMKMRGTFSDPALDITLLGHEVGHLVHYQAATAQAARLTEADTEGVDEGTANLLSALYLGESVIGRYEFGVPGQDINMFVRLPDLVITRRQSYESNLRSVVLKTKYPAFAKIIQDNLNNPDLQVYLDQPDGYQTSAVINQPMWQAALRFGFRKIQMVYLKSLRSLSATRDYLDLAKAIVEVVQDDKELYQFLVSEFRLRGLSV